MATKREEESTTMLIRVNEGTQESVVNRSRSFNYISPNTTDDDARTIFTRIGALQTLPVTGILRRDTAALVEDE